MISGAVVRVARCGACGRRRDGRGRLRRRHRSPRPRGRDRTRRALGKAEGKDRRQLTARRLRPAYSTSLRAAPAPQLPVRLHQLTARPTTIFRPDSQRCTTRWALPPSGSTRSCRTCRRTRRCPARPDRSATTSSTGSRRSWGRRALAATASPLFGRLCAGALTADPLTARACRSCARRRTRRTRTASSSSTSTSPPTTHLSRRRCSSRRRSTTAT